MKFAIAIIFIFSSTFSQAQSGSGFVTGNEDWGRSRISEFHYSKTGREILKPVYLLGAVAKPGLYHVPIGTPYITLLSLSGGPNGTADSEEILLTRSDGTQKNIKLKDIMGSSREYSVAEGDTLFIPAKVGWFDSAQTNDVTVMVSLLTLLLTAYIVADSTK